MKCVKPLIVHGTRVPCGTCEACRDAKVKEWSIRLMHEMGYCHDGVFVTLTYDDAYLPYDGSLDPEEFSGFVKRLRRLIEPRTIRYFGCGEYGGREGRPHYHLIVFGLERCLKCSSCVPRLRRSGREPVVGTDCAMVREAWRGYGHVDIGDVTVGSAKYVAGYLTKNIGEVEYGGREPAFARMSRGIGLPWLREHAEELVKDFGIRQGTSVYPMPRFYQRKLVDLLGDSGLLWSWLMKRVAIRRGMIRDREDLEWLTDRYSDVELGVGYRKRLYQRKLNIAASRRMKESKL